MSRYSRGLPDPADPRHGTATGRRTYGCDCDRCKAAHADRKQAERIRHEADRRRCTCATCVGWRRTDRAVGRVERAQRRAAELAAAEQRWAVERAARGVTAGEAVSDPASAVHGRYSTYTNQHCRCTRCRGAATAYTDVRHARADGLIPQEWAENERRTRAEAREAAKNARHAAILNNLNDPRHGKRPTYVNYGCRCSACSSAHSAYNRMMYRKARAASG